MFQPITWSGRPAKWLKITAVFELILAAVFAVIGYRVPILRGGFYLTAAILGVVGLLLLAWARRMGRGYQEANRLRATGIRGQARIVSMRQTGMYLNEQPQVELTLEVTTEMHGPYRVTRKEWVPLIALGRLSSGLPLPVKVDAADQTNLIVEWEAGGVAAPMAGGMTIPAGADSSGMNPSTRAAEKARILRDGTPGTARVLSSSATGQNDSEGRPVYDFMLHIEVPGRAPMQGPARTGIPPDRIDRLEPGDTIPIKVDPANPASMAVDWDSA